VAPAKLYLPATHISATGEAVVAPAVHLYPASQSVHDVAPTKLYLPATHLSATGEEVVAPAVQLYPASQSVHDVAPTKLYLPATHISDPGEAVVAPAVHLYPASHAPLQTAEGKPAVAPYLPAGHDVHATSPLKLYVPAKHTEATGFEVMEPAGHAYPAPHAPLQTAEGKPAVAPYLPAGHLVQLFAFARL